MDQHNQDQHNRRSSEQGSWQELKYFEWVLHLNFLDLKIRTFLFYWMLNYVNYLKTVQSIYFFFHQKMHIWYLGNYKKRGWKRFTRFNSRCEKQNLGSNWTPLMSHAHSVNPKRAGFFGPISQPGGGFHPPRSRKPIDEISSVWY